MRWFFGTLALVGLALAAMILAGRIDRFVAVWVLGIGWTVYEGLFRVVVELELADDRLRWSAGWRTGTIQVGDILWIRPRNWLTLSPMVYIDVAHGKTLTVKADEGFSRITRAIAAKRPDMPIELGQRVARVERLNRS